MDLAFEDAVERRVAARTVELQRAVREADSFSNSVAHDLRAPLRTIKGFARILQEDFAPQLPAQARAHLDTIHNGVSEMETLIHALLGLSRADREPLQVQPVLPEPIVRQALRELQPEISERSVSISVTPLPRCHADAALLVRVWSNLLSNALKFTRQRDPAVIQIGARHDGGRVAYFVRDNGVGFDMRHAPRLFDPFYRLHATSTYEGSGIGLSIAHRIVRRHGGEMWCESEPGLGATFLFTLEAAAA